MAFRRRCVTLFFSYLLLLVYRANATENETLSLSGPEEKIPQQESINCPPWFFYNPATKQCECFRSVNTDSIVECTEQGALVRFGSCMTYEEGEGTFVGRCHSFEISGHNVSERFPGFITLPDNISELNDYMCRPMNRRGLVCSECVEGFGPAVTFYGFSCSNCTDAWYGIPLYLFIEFVPITIFYLIILVFRVGLTSSPFTAFVLFCQFAVTAVTAVLGPFSLESTPVLYYFSVVITFYGFWNLDFFRVLIPPFCVSPNLEIIHVIFLGYISAFYPLILIGVTWICIELHSRNFKIFVWTWKKLSGCCLKFTKRESKSTIIDVFSTFLLLSYTKIIAIFVDTIEPDFIPNMNNLPTRRVLRADPRIEWLGVGNSPYLVVSLFLFLVLIIPPVVLLLVYPTKAFRSLLLKCSRGGYLRAALNIFVEKFYDSYRDGLDGGRDMRSMASLYFILRIFVYLISIPEHYLIYNGLLVGGVTVLVALLQPYKKTYMNVIDVLLLADLTFCLIMFDLYFSEPLGSTARLFFALCIGSIGSLPMWIFIGYIIYLILPFKRIFSFLREKLPICKKIVPCCDKATDSERDVEASPKKKTEPNARSNDELELPDRILNPELYDGDNMTYKT